MLCLLPSSPGVLAALIAPLPPACCCCCCCAWRSDCSCCACCHCVGKEYCCSSEKDCCSCGDAKGPIGLSNGPAAAQLLKGRRLLDRSEWRAAPPAVGEAAAAASAATAAAEGDVCQLGKTGGGVQLSPALFSCCCCSARSCCKSSCCCWSCRSWGC